MMFNWLARANC